MLLSGYKPGRNLQNQKTEFEATEK